MFDSTQCPPEVPDGIRVGVNEVIDRLRATLVTRIVLSEPPFGIRLLNLVRAYLQAHLRRCLTFLDGGHAEYLAGRPLMTELASRAIYENVAALCDFADKLKPLCDSGDLAAIKTHLETATLATRIPSMLAQHGDVVKATNVLTQIDRMVKRYGEFREAYDHLSDIVHPNALGAINYFATIGDNLVSFVEGSTRPERAIHSLFMAAFLLAFVEVDIAEIERRLRALALAITEK
jgi:hypothetical protein